ANSMPSLQRVGRKLRFGFGASDGWKEATTSGDVLVVDSWNHVAAAFDGTTVNFFVNGVLVGSSMALSGKRPNASEYSLLVGRSDNKWAVNFTSVSVGKQGESGKAEGGIRLFNADGSGRASCYDDRWETGKTETFGCWGDLDWSPGGWFQLWEEDCNPTSEYNTGSCGDGIDRYLTGWSFYGANLNGPGSRWAGNDTEVTLNWTISGQNAVPLKGILDEMSAYKRALGADQVLAMYEASRLGQVLRLNEPPGSTEYRDATGTYKLTCADPKCPTAGVAGRLAQGLQFAAGQTLSAPWQGGGEANTVGVWFKTSTRGRTLFTLGGDRQVSLDANGNLVGAYDPGMPSLQKLKWAAQSTDLGGYLASNAIDGNLDTFNHTNLGTAFKSYWEAFLDAGAQRISRVRVYNRFDGSWERLNPFVVVLFRGSNVVWRSGNIEASVTGNPNPIVVPVPNIVADRVQIQLVNSNYLHLAEVEVETDPLTLSNASQSSTATGYPASNAIDENLSTFGNTNATTENWWQADIDGASPIVSAIRLYNRRDANQFKLSPFNVVLYDASGIEVWRKNQVTHDRGNNALVISVPNIVAKRVRIEHLAPEYLHFAEIRLDTWASELRSIATSGVNYADGQWHHVMYMMGDAAVGQRLFVDGVQKAVGVLPSSNGAASKNRGGSIVLGGADASGFDGYMDQVRLFSRGEGLATAQKLFAEAPVIGLKLDEPANSTTFANVAGGANAACTACPTMGTNGKIGSAANFNGTSSIATASTTVPGAFSFGLWANAREWSAGALLVERTPGGMSSVWNNQKLYIEDGVMKFKLPAGQSIASIVTMTLPALNQWNHIVVNYDGAALQMYLNGSLAKSLNVSYRSDMGTDTPFRIGSGYKGLIDEFTMYQRALTPPEIRGDYQYQLGLIAERSTARIVVDATPPQAIIDLADNLYVPNVDRIVSVQAIDTGSVVPFLSFTSQRSGEGAAVQGRSLQCIDSASSGAWCPTFTPRGEGSYTLRAIGRDGVGNASSPASKTMFVDTTPPQLAVNAPPTVTRPAILPDGSREVVFSGTVSDPALTNAGGVVAGSGVQTSSVLVELIDPDGDVVEGAAQSALVAGTVWTASFIVGAGQYGNFSIRARAADRVGNVASATRSAVLIDVVDPVLSFDANMPGVVSQTTVFSGAVSEIPVDGSAAIYMPFEEPANAVGYVGRAATFTGTKASVITSMFNGIITGTFSVAGWIKRNAGTGWSNPILAAENGFQINLPAQPAAANPTQFIKIRTETSLRSYDTKDPNAAYAADTWTHIALVAEPNKIKFYVNGVPVSLTTQSAITNFVPVLFAASPMTLYVGTSVQGISSLNPNIGPYFNGMIDELAVYRSALSVDEVRRLAQPVVAGVPGVEVAFKPVASAASSEPVDAAAGPVAYFPLDDIVGADNATGYRNMIGATAANCGTVPMPASLGTQCPTSGARGMRDAAVTFDGVNDSLLLNVPNVPNLSERFTFAAWVRPDWAGNTPLFYGGFGRTYFSLNYGEIWLGVGNGATNLANARVPYSYVPGQWIHVAAVVSTTGYVLYANGVSVGSGAFSGSPILADYKGLKVGSDGGYTFGAFGLDDVRIYSRTLSAPEIYGLYAGRDPVLTLDFANGIGDVSAWAQPVSRFGGPQLPEGQGIAVLNGTTDALTVAPKITLANRSWSVGAWAKRGSIGTADVIFGQGQA
ncbi:MAG: hypothetical protein NTZ50_05560, partial [Chloroflexi bacterium]|nr:hypothetical protein [Chloroflexota bacterium]